MNNMYKAIERKEINMLNIIWPIFIIVSCAYGVFTGRVEQINNSIFSSVEDAVSLCITFLGTITLWNGIMNIAKETTIMEKLTKLFNPIIKFLFPEVYKNQTINKDISMNVVANVLGLGNAATPLGIKAMQSMQEENKQKDTLSNSMIMFIVINTASIQIIPTSIIAIRSSLGSSSPTQIMIPVWISSICAVITVITVTKILLKVRKE